MRRQYPLPLALESTAPPRGTEQAMRDHRLELIRHIGFILLLMICGVLCGISTSNAGLYPAAAPPGSAFIRVFNATTGNGLAARVGDKTLGNLDAFDGSGFVFLPPGNYPLQAGSHARTVTLAGNHYYTAVVLPAEIQIFEQDRFDSQLKASISLFNLSSSPVSLRTADGKLTLVPETPVKATGHREVNPARASLAVYQGETKLAEAKPLNFERGISYALFVAGDASAPVVTWLAK